MSLYYCIVSAEENSRSSFYFCFSNVHNINLVPKMSHPIITEKLFTYLIVAETMAITGNTVKTKLLYYVNTNNCDYR